MAVQTFKISDLAEAVANPDTDHVEISRDNGNGTFSSFKAPAGGGGGVAVGQTLLQIAAQPLDPDYLRLDGGTYPKASYPEIAQYFPTASDWGLGGSADTTASVGTVSNQFAFALSNDGGKMYVSKPGSGTIEIYETSGWTLTNTITINNGWATSFNPDNIRLSQDGTLLIIGVDTSNETTTEITLVDTLTETVITHIPDSHVVQSSTLDYLYHMYSFNFTGTKILYTSQSNTGQINVFDISSGTITLSFSSGFTSVFTSCFKYDNDYIISSGFDGSNRVIQMHNTSGILSLGPVIIPEGVNLFPTRRTSNYIYATDANLSNANSNIFKISTSDFSTIDTYTIVGGERAYISESGTGEYLAVGSNDSGRGYFFVLNDDTFTMVSGFPAAPGFTNRTHIAKNDLRLAFGFNSTPYFTVVDQLGSLDDFVISDLSNDTPDLTFEYRIKAK